MHSVTSNAVAFAMLFNPKLHIADTRNDNFAPGYYLATYGGQTVQEFKNTSVINTPFDTGTFCTLVTITPWVDLSGGLPTQFAINTYGSGEIKYRVASDINSWGAWTRLGRNTRIFETTHSVDLSTLGLTNLSYLIFIKDWYSSWNLCCLGILNAFPLQGGYGLVSLYDNMGVVMQGASTLYCENHWLYQITLIPLE